jgi:hypothetical protein
VFSLSEKQIPRFVGSALLGYLLTAGKATVAEFEVELKMNRRTLQRDLKLLVKTGLGRATVGLKQQIRCQREERVPDAGRPVDLR